MAYVPRMRTQSVAARAVAEAVADLASAPEWAGPTYSTEPALLVFRVAVLWHEHRIDQPGHVSHRSRSITPVGATAHEDVPRLRRSTARRSRM